MMRAILFLSLVGAALYGFLVVTGDALTETNSKQGGDIQAQSNHSEGERLSSWDSYLPSRSQYQNPQLAFQPATSPSQKGDDARHNSARDQWCVRKYSSIVRERWRETGVSSSW